MKRLMGRGNPDGAALRAGYAALRDHMGYIGHLAGPGAGVMPPAHYADLDF